jgi:excisionase family DNA binding protein
VKKKHGSINDRMKAEGYITVAEAAEMTGIPKASVYRLLEEDKVEYLIVGERTKFIKEKSLVEYLGPAAKLILRKP